MTTVAIHQPQYLPWLPYIDKVDQADIFVYLDIVQYQRRGVQNRNQIKTPEGLMWLTVPVKAGYTDRICDVTVAEAGFARKHIASLRHAYARARYADRLNGLIALLDQRWTQLVELNIATTAWLFEQFGVTTHAVRASKLAGVSGAKDELILSVCRAVGADRYLSGLGARAYQRPERFTAENVELVYQRYSPSPYTQCHPTLAFVPELSALDLVLCHGPRARELMLAGRRASLSPAELNNALVDPTASVDDDAPQLSKP